MNGTTLKPSNRHCQAVAKFLTGETSTRVSNILDMWFKSPYGLPPETHPERAMLYSSDIDYQEIKYARPALTSFSARIIQEKLVRDISRTVRSRKLHTFTTRQDQGGVISGGLETSIWGVKGVISIFEEDVPLLWRYLMALASSNQGPSRERRPPEYVHISQII